MVPINTIKDGQVVDIYTGELYNNIVSICNEHKRTNRALAFAFLLYNFKNPQISKILEDRHYFQSLHLVGVVTDHFCYTPFIHSWRAFETRANSKLKDKQIAVR